MGSGSKRCRDEELSVSEEGSTESSAYREADTYALTIVTAAKGEGRVRNTYALTI